MRRHSNLNVSQTRQKWCLYDKYKMSMIVNMETATQKGDSDVEGEDLLSINQQHVEPSREPTPDIPSRPKVKFELTNFEHMNSLLHSMFVRGDYDECKRLIWEMLEHSSDHCEFAMFMHGLISRLEGQLDNAVSWFQKGLQLSTKDPKYLRELGRVFFLQGNQSLAIEALEAAVKGNPKDSKAYYWLARSLYHIKTDIFDAKGKARDILVQAPMILQNFELLVFLGELQVELGEVSTSIEAFKKALEIEPENVDVMYKLGMLYMKMDNENQAFAMFGKALSYDPIHQESILAAGSIMQAHGDHDVALNKYRVAVDSVDYNACLWNNIAMCLFSKGKHAAAHSCLKKALFIDPIDFKINFNLGLVHQAMGMHCSALHYFKTSYELHKDDPKILGAVAVAFSSMGDVNNARKAYELAVSKDADHRTILNFSIFEMKNNDKKKAVEVLEIYKERMKKGVRQELHSEAARLEQFLLDSEETPKREEVQEEQPAE